MDKEQTINALEELKRYSQSAVVHSLSDETVEIAISAIGKQIPCSKIRVCDDTTDSCRKCDEEFCGKYKYCPNCGQRIDWSDF